MAEWLTSLTHAVQGAPHIALGAAFVWGILSIVLSPCHLSSIPLIVGFIGEQENLTTRRAFAISSVFAIGILFTIAAGPLGFRGLSYASAGVSAVVWPWSRADFFPAGCHVLIS